MVCGYAPVKAFLYNHVSEPLTKVHPCFVRAFALFLEWSYRMGSTVVTKVIIVFIEQLPSSLVWRLKSEHV